MDKYKKYKNTGFEIIGEIPRHWEVTSFKRVSSICTGTKNTEDELVDGKYDFFVRSDKIRKINSYSFDGEAILTAGDGVGVGRVFHYVNGKFDYHQRVYKFSNFKKHDGKFLYYYIKSKMPMQLKAESAKVTIDSIRLPMIQKFLLPVPLFKEQLAIANFLDEKTGVIDSAVEELVKQRKLLEELKQATIHKAVTKGLDDNVEMKDSGIEWIGEIPVDWKINHLKNLINYTTGNTPSTTDESYYDTNGLYPWTNISDLKSKLLFKTEKYLSKNGVKSKNMTLVPEGSLLFAFKLSVGNSSINKIPVYTNEAIAAFKENKKINIDWLYYFMSTLFKNNAKENIYGAPLLNRQLIENGIILEAPKKEQEKIANFLNDQTSKINKSLEEIESKINHLKEYKKTLINDAVTGKIKVYKGDV